MTKLLHVDNKLLFIFFVKNKFIYKISCQGKLLERDCFILNYRSCLSFSHYKINIKYQICMVSSTQNTKGLSLACCSSSVLARAIKIVLSYLEYKSVFYWYLLVCFFLNFVLKRNSFLILVFVLSLIWKTKVRR